jgi:dipeptidyl aminopeptidase/acylaminoacyl peptidase
MLRYLIAAWLGVAALSPSHAATAAATRWTVPAQIAVSREDITFTGEGGAPLHGTLYVPRKTTPVGAIVVTHGASSPLRTSPLYQHLVQIAPSLGLALLIYDRRGSGASSAAKTSENFDVLADDAIGAVDFLRRDSRIDPARVGVWGLSQGGWLAVLAAAHSPHVKFAVSISAPIVTPDIQMMFLSTNSMLVFGYSASDIAQMQKLRKAVDDYTRGSVSREYAQSLIDQAKDKPWYKYLYMGTRLHGREHSDWRAQIEMDPLKTLAMDHVPTLMIYGGEDPVVPVAPSVARVKKLQASHPQLRLAVIPGADHGMQLGVSPRDLLDPAKGDEEHPNAPAYFATLAAWLEEIGVTRTGASGQP